MILNGLPWKWTEIILPFLRMHPSTAFQTLVDYDHYSISSKRFLTTVVDVVVLWVKVTHSSPFLFAEWRSSYRWVQTLGRCIAIVMKYVYFKNCLQHSAQQISITYSQKKLCQLKAVYFSNIGVIFPGCVIAKKSFKTQRIVRNTLENQR